MISTEDWDYFDYSKTLPQVETASSQIIIMYIQQI